jgi:hypothetical protein
MKAVVDEDVRTVGVHDVADATIEAASDAVVRVTFSAICGTAVRPRPPRRPCARWSTRSTRSARPCVVPTSHLSNRCSRR